MCVSMTDGARTIAIAQSRPKLLSKRESEKQVRRREGGDAIESGMRTRQRGRLLQPEETGSGKIVRNTIQNSSSLSAWPCCGNRWKTWISLFTNINHHPRVSHEAERRRGQTHKHKRRHSRTTTTTSTDTHSNAKRLELHTQ